MKLSYPYQSKSSPSFGKIPTIKFWLNVESRSKSIPFLFLFDTGADITSLPASVAKKLGIDLDTCPQETMTGYEGATVIVYKSEITITFNRKSLKIPCVFNPSEEVPILLGRAGILDKFTILLDARNKVIVLEEI